MGITPLPEALKPDAMPDELRNSLWNAIDAWFPEQYAHHVFNGLWREYWKKPTDTIPTDLYGEINLRKAMQVFRDYFFRAEWHQVYDCVEFLISGRGIGERLEELVNAVLVEEIAAYRVVDHQFVNVTAPPRNRGTGKRNRGRRSVFCCGRSYFDRT
jgi:hypothetical protein